MTIVIISAFADYHAAAIRWALESVGFTVKQWEGLGHEVPRQAWLELVPNPRVHLGNITVADGDVVWFRRPRRFSFHPIMAECDRRFAGLEAARFYECLAASLDAIGCKCINPPSEAWAINRKAVQILLAQQSGLLVPLTMMGNEPQQIIQNLRGCKTRLIYKGFLPHSWENYKTGEIAVARTSQMTIPAEGEEDRLTFAPGIYQQLIAKRYDARVIVFGKHVRAFLIQADALDFRIDAALGHGHIEEVPVPDEILAGVDKFMTNAGIVTGSFDFAIDKHGCWWFLEVNESGQFLWIDSMLPEAHLFEDFLSFLTGADRGLFPPLGDFKFDTSAFPNLTEEEKPFATIERGV